MVKQRWFLSVALFSVIANAQYYEGREKGWFWYETQPVKPSVAVIEEHATQTTQVSPPTPAPMPTNEERLTLENALEKRDGIRAKVEAAQALAVLEPTQENIYRYIQLQNELSQRSVHFTKQWQKVVWQNPEVDFSVENPTNQYARQAYYDEMNQQTEQKLVEFGKTQGLFFFFRSDCPYCHKFAPVLKAFAQKYHIDVMAISLDGGILPDFPSAQVDNGAAQTLEVTTVPAVFAVNPTTQAVAPVSFGMLSAQELAQRIQALMQSSEDNHG